MYTKAILEIIKPIRLVKGHHKDTGKTGQGCAMNVIAYLNGEAQITDNSECVCVTVRRPIVWLNDYLNDYERQELIPFLLRAIGSATESKDVIETRLAHVVQFAKRVAEIAQVKGANFTDAKAATVAATISREYASRVCGYSEEAIGNIKVTSNASAATSSHAAHCAAIAIARLPQFANLREQIKQAAFEFLDAALPKTPMLTLVNFERAKVLASLNPA